MTKAVSKGTAYLFVCLSSVSGLLAARWVFHQSFIGLDFQDESFFLNMALHPLEYPEMPTRIGVCLKPLFLIVGENIPRLRQLSFVLLALGLYLNFFFARKVGTFITPGICERTSMVGLASVVACFSWIARGGTCRSLGYNQQTCVLMLFLSAAVLAWFAGKGKTNLRKWSWPHFFTGLGVTWLAMAKPPAIFFWIPFCAIFLIPQGFFKCRRDLGVLSLGAFTILLPYFLLCESPWDLWFSLSKWPVWESILQSGHGLKEVTIFNFKGWLYNSVETFGFFGMRFFAFCFALALAMSVFKRKHLSTTPWLVGCMLLLPFSALSGNLEAFSSTLSQTLNGGFALGLSLLSACLLFHFFAQNGQKWRHPVLLWCISLTIMSPFLYSYGSEVDFQSRAGGAASVYIGMPCTLLIFLLGSNKAVWMPNTLLCLMLMYILSPKWTNPTLYQADRRIVGKYGSLYLDALDTASFYTFLDSIKAAGWEAGDLVLDLWGRYPGITFLMEGKSPEWPWYMSTECDGINEFTHFILSKEMDTIALKNLWVLEASPSLPHVQIKGLPAPVGQCPKGYVLAGVLRFKPHNSSPEVDVRLWKPSI